MDPTSAVRTDTLPAIATIVLPGVLASGGYAWWALQAEPAFVEFLMKHGGLALMVALLVLVLCGFIVETLGSFLEVDAVDKTSIRPDQLRDEWWSFLRIEWKTEPVGHRYLRRSLTSFKFELNMCVASVVAMPAAAVLTKSDLVTQTVGWQLIAMLLAIAVVFYSFCASSAELMANVRHSLIQGVWTPPLNPPAVELVQFYPQNPKQTVRALLKRPSFWIFVAVTGISSAVVGSS